jgi:hypothetical protein
MSSAQNNPEPPVSAQPKKPRQRAGRGVITGFAVNGKLFSVNHADLKAVNACETEEAMEKILLDAGEIILEVFPDWESRRSSTKSGNGPGKPL